MNSRSLLQDFGLEVFSQNENMRTIQPWTVTSGGSYAVILKVKDEEFEKAKKITEDYENGNLSIESEESKK